MIIVKVLPLSSRDSVHVPRRLTSWDTLVCPTYGRFRQDSRSTVNDTIQDPYVTVCFVYTVGVSFSNLRSDPTYAKGGSQRKGL